MYNHRIRAMAQHELDEVIKAKGATTTPRDAVELLVREHGERNATRMVAMLVNAVSLHDGRIYESVREWAQSVRSAPTHEDLQEIEIYGVDSYIHSAHVNQIGQAMKTYLKEQNDKEV